MNKPKKTSKKEVKAWIAVCSTKNSKLLYSTMFQTKKEAKIVLKDTGWKIIKAQVLFNI